MIARALKTAVLALVCGCTLASTTATPTMALDFQCIEPSRYKNLLQIFEDNPSTFFSYFNIPRQPLPAPDSCRALLVIGAIDDNAAGALLDHIIEGRGWLAALHLAFSGTNLAQEVAMAAIVREFSLKTYQVPGRRYPYQPDFAAYWTPAVGRGGFLSAPAVGEVSSIESGMDAYEHQNRAVRLDRKARACTGSCRTVWAAGVNRISGLRGSSAEAGGADDGNLATEHLRDVIAYHLDYDRPPAAGDQVPVARAGRIPVTPPVVMASLRKECDAEITVTESLESRVADAFSAAAGKKLDIRAVTAIAPQLNALKRAGAHLQQCLAAVHETMRLRTFQTFCSAGCDRAALLEKFSNQASALLKEAGAP